MKLYQVDYNDLDIGSEEYTLQDVRDAANLVEEGTAKELLEQVVHYLNNDDTLDLANCWYFLVDEDGNGFEVPIVSPLSNKQTKDDNINRKAEEATGTGLDKGTVPSDS